MGNTVTLNGSLIPASDAQPRPSLALDNLQETENLQGTEREKAEEVVAKTLASMYAGE